MHPARMSEFRFHLRVLLIQTKRLTKRHVDEYTELAVAATHGGIVSPTPPWSVDI